LIHSADRRSKLTSLPNVAKSPLPVARLDLHFISKSGEVELKLVEAGIANEPIISSTSSRPVLVSFNSINYNSLHLLCSALLDSIKSRRTIGDSVGEQVAWLRVESKTILTIHETTITRNYRIGLNHADNRRWELIIRQVQESDRGGYMCQINTGPMKYQVAYLDVVGTYHSYKRPDLDRFN
jgi:hypothetical protein